MQIDSEMAAKYTLRTSPIKNRPGTWDSTRCEILCNGEKIGEYIYTYHDGAPFHPFRKNGREYALYSRDYTATRVMRLPECKDLGGEGPEGWGFCPTGYAVPFGTYTTQDPPETLEDPHPANPRWLPKVWAKAILREDGGIQYEWPAEGTPEGIAFKAACKVGDEESAAWSKRHPYVEKPFNGEFGFVCGCVWGDDSSWKIRYVDLSRVEEGILTIDSRMGYIELLGEAKTLAGAIDLSDWEPSDQMARISCAKEFDLAKEVDPT